MPSADIAVIGLAVMGENLALNIESRGYTVAVFNYTLPEIDAFIRGRGRGRRFIAARSPAELCAALRRPRRILLMVKAGPPVDHFIEQLLPLLDDGDILIDGGNTHFADTTRRTRAVEQRGKLYIGTGVSGGEEGALHGPAIMAGGSAAAWPHVEPIFRAIAARTADGTPCCAWVGPDGAGHFVKMVHNGIEYGDMQLIGEAYHLLRAGLGLSLDELRDTFDQWNRGELNSYLIEITRDIFGHRDAHGAATLDQVLDTAGQKGTGKWAVHAALDAGQPLTLIGEAVLARCLSALKSERVAASELLCGPRATFGGDRPSALEDVRQALYASKIVSYAQGYQLMRAVAQEQAWPLNYGGIALLWRGGCIIRAAFLDRIQAAFDRDPQLVNLLLDPFFRQVVTQAQPAWRRTVTLAVQLGVPAPAMSSALAYFDGYRSARLPANLLQAQRDYFGAHTYERIDRPRGEFFHTNWTGRGGTTASSTYNA